MPPGWQLQWSPKKTDDREQLALLARFHERRRMKYDLQADYIALSRLATRPARHMVAPGAGADRLRRRRGRKKIPATHDRAG